MATGKSVVASLIAELPMLRRPTYCFVLDISASMEGVRLAEMKSGCLAATAELLMGDCDISVIAFQSRADVVVRRVQALGDVKERIQILESGGTTALDQALDLALEVAGGNPVGVVHVITDGNPDCVDSTLASASRIKKAGLCIRCTGVTGADQAFLRRIAGGEPEPQATVTQPSELKSLIARVASLPIPRCK